MFQALMTPIYAALVLALVCGIIPLAVAIVTRDKPRIDHLLDVYTEVFKASALALIGVVQIFRRRNTTTSHQSDLKAGPDIG